MTKEELKKVYKTCGNYPLSELIKRKSYLKEGDKDRIAIDFLIKIGEGTATEKQRELDQQIRFELMCQDIKSMRSNISFITTLIAIELVGALILACMYIMPPH